MNIPFSTLQARMKKYSYSDPSLGRHPVFSDQTENKMAQEIKNLANIFYGCYSDKENTNSRKARYKTQFQQ